MDSTFLYRLLWFAKSATKFGTEIFFQNETLKYVDCNNFLLAPDTVMIVSPNTKLWLSLKTQNWMTYKFHQSDSLNSCKVVNSWFLWIEIVELIEIQLLLQEKISDKSIFIHSPIWFTNKWLYAKAIFVKSEPADFEIRSQSASKTSSSFHS